MYNNYYSYPVQYPYYNNPAANPYNPGYQPPYWYEKPFHRPVRPKPSIHLKDYGPQPLVINIEAATRLNNNFRLALWTGCHLQLTLMSINVGEDIGLEVHPHLDQFLRIEEGQGLVMMGDCKEQLNLQAMVCDGYAIFVPAGKYHNLINTGCKPLKLYSIYAPPEHPHGTIHRTKEAEEHYGH